MKTQYCIQAKRKNVTPSCPRSEDRDWNDSFFRRHTNKRVAMKFLRTYQKDSHGWKFRLAKISQEIIWEEK